MGYAYINRFMANVNIADVLEDGLMILTSAHSPGDILNNKIIRTECVWHGNNIPTQEEFESIIYQHGQYVVAIDIDAIDDICTSTDMTKYGFIRITSNRFCKTQQSIMFAKLESGIPIKR